MTSAGFQADAAGWEMLAELGKDVYELDDAETFRIGDVVSKNRGMISLFRIIDRCSQSTAVIAEIEDVVAKNQSNSVVSDKVSSDCESLSYAFRLWLLSV